jgi:hypothetical protein
VQSSVLPFITAPPEEDMPLNDADRAWIRQEIQAGFKREGRGKLTGFIKDWGGLGGAVAVIIFILVQWNVLTEFRVHTNDRLDSIEKQLLILRASESPDSVFRELNSFSLNRFAQSLPALQRVVEHPFTEVKAPQSAIKSMAQKLLQTDEHSPDYWPTVLQFIQFASAGLSPDVPPRSAGREQVINNHGDFSLGTVSGKVVLLDGGDLVNTHFYNSRIIFTQNPVHMRNVAFSDCVFELPVVAIPNQYLQNTSRELLASDIKSATLSGL